MILAYQVGVFVIWRSGRRNKRSPRIVELRKKDEDARAERLARFAQARKALEQAAVSQTAAFAPKAMTPKPAGTTRQATSLRPNVSRGTYLNTLTPRRTIMDTARQPNMDVSA